MHVREIVVHVAPDLDGLVGAWLLRRFGESRFPGASKAPVRFLAGGQVDGPALEAEGVLAVDVGGGRFDHHFDSTSEATSAPGLCASELVAAELQLAEVKSLTKILGLARRRDIEGVGVKSPDPLDQAGHLVSLIDGWNGLYPDDPDRVLELGWASLDAIYENERAWHDALDEVDRDRPLRFASTGVLVDWFESDNKRLMKASRYRRRDACVVRSTRGNTGVNVAFNSPRVQVEDVLSATAYLRLFECRATGEAPRPERLREVGNHHGWYLHSSHRLVMAGSDKEPTAPRSVLPTELVAELVGVSLHPTHTFPGSVCPVEHCAGASCFLFAHDLPHCSGPKARGIRNQ